MLGDGVDKGVGVTDGGHHRLYDITNGWNGHPGGEVPMVVLTHHPPQDWPRGGVPIYFETTVEAAVAKARELAGDRNVDIAGATVTRACLDAGLLDAIQVGLVPVILGAGIPWLAGTRGPVRLSDPEVREDPGGGDPSALFGPQACTGIVPAPFDQHPAVFHTTRSGCWRCRTDGWRAAPAAACR